MFNPESKECTYYPIETHKYVSEHIIATLASTITNHNQNIKAAFANSNETNNRDTNTTVSLDGMASCCNLHRERN